MKMQIHLGDLRIGHSVRWNDEEKTELADRVHRLRGRYPGLTLVALVNRAQQPTQQNPWPEDRVRQINTIGMVQWLVPKLRALDLEMRDQIEREIPALKQRIDDLSKRLTKEEILEQLFPEEIVRRFGNIVVENFTAAELVKLVPPDQILPSISIGDLYTYVGQRIFRDMSALEQRVEKMMADQLAQQPAFHTNGVVRKRGKTLLRLAVVGLQQHHVPTLQSHVGDQCTLVYIPKSKSKAQSSGINQLADLCAVWEDHIVDSQLREVRPQFPHDTLMLHRGTFNEMIPKVISFLKLKSK